MLQNELINKVKKYLDKVNYKYLTDTLVYVGIRENQLQLNGEKMSMHIISFLVLQENGIYTNTYYINIDVKTNKLMYLITPNVLKKIYE